MKDSQATPSLGSPADSTSEERQEPSLPAGDFRVRRPGIFERPLESYPSAVLAEFIRGRMISYFPEELEYAERRLREKERSNAAIEARNGTDLEGSMPDLRLY